MSRQSVHPEDQRLIDEGKLSEETAVGLRLRREKHFANPIKGPVHAGRLERRTICAYAPPSLTTTPVTVLISVYVITFYETVGASLGLLAFFQGLARAFDVITDPTMSYLTDSYRSKSGRRRPFLASGAPVYGLCLFCLLCPWPSFSETTVSIWFGVFYLLFFLSSTYCNIPYDALGPELTDNQEDRSLLFFVCTMFDGIGGLAVAVLPVGFGSAFAWYREDNSYRYTSCETPQADGRIDALGTAGPWFWTDSTPPPDILSWFAFVSQSSDYYGWTRTFCNDIPATILELETFSEVEAEMEMISVRNFTMQESLDLASWCGCVQRADVVHELDSTRYAYLTVGFFFGMWAIVSFLWCVFVVKERSQLGGTSLGDPKPLVPSILNTFNNRPFTLLLPAWVFDSLANALIASLLTYFVRYVVAPEYSNQAAPPEGYGCAPQGGSDDWRCDSTYVVAMSFLAFLVGVIGFTPLWLWLTKRFGKRNIWLAWSLINGLTFLCFAFVQRGQVIVCVIMSIFNGAPAGAKFLADSIMADVIDYDEFLTGERAEATYTMFKGFLPKIAAIPASALPIALLASVGHVPVTNGVIQEQPDSVTTFIRITIIYIPFLLSVLSFLLKLRFPLTTDKHIEMITEGIAAHLMGKEAMDPVSLVYYRPLEFEEDELESANLMDNFLGVKIIDDLMENWETGVAALKRDLIIQLVLSLVWLITFAVISGSTFSMLEGELQYIPVLAIVAFGLGITAVAFCSMRLNAVVRLASVDRPSPVVLNKLKTMRTKLADLKKFSTSICRDATALPLDRSLRSPDNADAAADSEKAKSSDNAEKLDVEMVKIDSPTSSSKKNLLEED